jgi:hypothetical protein
MATGGAGSSRTTGSEYACTGLGRVLEASMVLLLAVVPAARACALRDDGVGVGQLDEGSGHGRTLPPPLRSTDRASMRLQVRLAPVPGGLTVPPQATAAGLVSSSPRTPGSVIDTAARQTMIAVAANMIGRSPTLSASGPTSA